MTLLSQYEFVDGPDPSNILGSYPTNKTFCTLSFSLFTPFYFFLVGPLHKLNITLSRPQLIWAHMFTMLHTIPLHPITLFPFLPLWLNSLDLWSTSFLMMSCYPNTSIPSLLTWTLKFFPYFSFPSPTKSSCYFSLVWLIGKKLLLLCLLRYLYLVSSKALLVLAFNDVCLARSPFSEHPFSSFDSWSDSLFIL